MNKHAKKLDDYLKKIPHADYQEQINDLANFLEVSRNVIYNYRCGKTHINKSVRDNIEEFFTAKIF